MKNAVYEMHERISENQPVMYRSDHLDDKMTCCPNWHENIEILCITEGRAEITIDSVSFIASERDIVVINSGRVHIVRALGAPVSYRCIIVDREFCKSLGFDTSTDYIQDRISDDDICTIFSEITDELRAKEKHYESAVKYLICEMLVKMYRTYSIPAEYVYENSGKSIIVKKAATFINTNCTHSISIDEIAGAVNVSKYYLCRIFKEIMGITMVEFINFRRCKKAFRMLERGDMSISEIAEACGFENMSYFSKIYKKYMNVLPSEQKKVGKVN